MSIFNLNMVRVARLAMITSFSILAACASMQEPPDTSVGSVKTYDLATADLEQVRASLLNDGRVIIRGINFDTDSTDLKGSAYASASRLGELMSADSQIVLAVVGHTDNTGDFNYNLDLSERRAAAIVGALKKDFEIGANRLVAVGVGEISPIATNDTDFGRSENRRVELIVIDG